MVLLVEGRLVKPTPAVRAARRRLPTQHLKPGIRAQLSAGMSPEAIARAVADAVDGLIAFDRIVPGPVGVVVELLDGPVIYAAALVLVREVRRAMERRAVGT
jgi:formaldehyde-activating enzyme involved in methanogenesis